MHGNIAELRPKRVQQGYNFCSSLGWDMMFARRQRATRRQSRSSYFYYSAKRTPSPAKPIRGSYYAPARPTCSTSSFRIKNLTPTSHLTSSLQKFLPARLFSHAFPTPITSRSSLLQLHITTKHHKAQGIFLQSSITLRMSSDLSLPRSPGSTLTDKGDMVDVESNGLYLELAPFGLEHIHDYEPGGHHPVHLGDVYGNNGRYLVIHKLGHGGFANVWLSRDTEAKEATKYVALKILMAEISNDDCPELRLNQLKATHNQNAPEGDGAESICLPLDHFKIHGPNGSHISFVYPVLGPNVSLGLFRASADPDNDLRSLSLQVVKAVKFLHSQGICHGDITPNNVLHRISGLDGLNEDEVLQILGSPVVNPVLNASKECHYKSTAPQYLVYPVSWWDVNTHFISKESCLIDFGESFKSSQPPNDLGIPGPYRSPELILDKKVGLGSDIWALGCSLFEIRTGRKLFSSFDDEDNDYLDAIVQVLGKLPEPWWSITWEDRRRMYKDEVDEQGLAVAALESEPSKDDPGEKESVVTSTMHQSVTGNARSLKDKIAPGLWYMSDRHPDGDRHRDIPQTEQEFFADLLGRLLEYKPEDRISAKDAINHEWFKL